MSVIQFLCQHKSAGWKAGLALLLVLGLYAFYSLLLSPTKIALVNFPSYQVSNIPMANDSRLIKVKEVKAEDASSLKSYDAILLFGPGLRLTEEQTENIEIAGENQVKALDDVSMSVEKGEFVAIVGAMLFRTTWQESIPAK